MDTGIYVALSKEIGIFRDMEVTANNIANVNTTGYQAEGLLFTDYLTPVSQRTKVAFANDIGTYHSPEQGTLQITNSPLDAAIQGKGYFVVQTPLGQRFTRSGNFKVDPTGVMVTPEGYPVLDETGQSITFDDSDRNINIHEDGTVNVDGSDRGVIKIVQFDNEQLLHRVGNTLYSSDATPKAPEDFKLISGALERANVNPFKALTHMMDVSRSATNTANFISTMYTLERKASDTLAKIYS